MRFVLLIIAAGLLYAGWHFSGESLVAVKQSNATAKNPNSSSDEDERGKLNELSHALTKKSWICYGLGALAVVASIVWSNRQLHGRTTIRES